MQAQDLEKLAHQFMLNAVRVVEGDNVWIEYSGLKAKALAEACAIKVQEVGGNSLLTDCGSIVMNATVGKMSVDEIKALSDPLLARTQTMQGYLRIIDDADQVKITLTEEQMSAYKKARHPSVEYRVNHTRWLVVAAATEEFAAECGMEFSDFKDFYRDVCLTDYQAMGEAVKPLTKMMAEGKKVHIVSPGQGTDLTFSIEDIPAVPCTGLRNIPDGECFTAPVKDSINGTIVFGPSVYDQKKFASVTLTFKDGKVVNAEAENQEQTAVLNKILDTDEGARYVGEFAINFNPYIQHPTGNILFDEKIDGGLHLALGKCYESAPNGNTSLIHWDLVHIQRQEYGGGSIFIDDVLIRENGIFVLPELLGLNPEALKGNVAKAKQKNSF